MSKPTVLFDADGFLLDFLTPALAVANKIVGRMAIDSAALPVPQDWRPYTINDFKTWDIFDTIGREHERACYLEYEKPGFCAAFEPYPGAVEGVREAKKIADVVIVTSPMMTPTWCHERKQSLYKHFGITSKDVIFANRKALVQGRILVDDNPKHVMEWAAAHFDTRGQGVLWDMPYNKEALVDGVRSYTRCVDSWDDLLGLIDML